MHPTEYDFRICKLCGESAASPRYRLAQGTVFTCRRCDFHALDYLDELPADQDQESASSLGDKEWNYIEERLGEADRWLEARLDLVRRHGRLPGAYALDVGAGVGQFLIRLRDEGAKICGIEPSRMRREFARRRFGLELIGRTIEHPWWSQNQAGRFDLITLWDVLEHVNFPRTTLAAAHRLLKPGGLLFIDTPSREAASYRLSERICRLSGIPLYLEQFYSCSPFGHKQIFLPRQLVRLAQQTGFSVDALRKRYPAETTPLLSPHNRILLVGRRL